uniref:Uncharacterized protein n=1 Tax=Panagrolaimus sp. PS1159 TaxID=55785 RepID=A0AC35FR08_9BILA
MNHKIEELPNNLGFSGTLYIQHENLLSQFISKCVICDLKCLKFINNYWEYNQHLKLSQKFIDKICASNLEEFVVYQLPENFKRETLLENMAKKKPNLHVYLRFK